MLKVLCFRCDLSFLLLLNREFVHNTCMLVIFSVQESILSWSDSVFLCKAVHPSQTAVYRSWEPLVGPLTQFRAHCSSTNIHPSVLTPAVLKHHQRRHARDWDAWRKDCIIKMSVCRLMLGAVDIDGTAASLLSNSTKIAVGFRDVVIWPPLCV